MELEVMELRDSSSSVVIAKKVKTTALVSLFSSHVTATDIEDYLK
jgi:hypothetical protein